MPMTNQEWEDAKGKLWHILRKKPDFGVRFFDMKHTQDPGGVEAYVRGEVNLGEKRELVRAKISELAESATDLADFKTKITAFVNSL